MSELVKKLYDFMVFIEFFGVKIVIGLLKNHYDLILTIEFDFCSNLTVGSSYIRWKSI